MRTRDEAKAAIAAGAAGLVSPTAVPDLVAVSNYVPHVPGAFTPTEVEAAWRGGAPLVKLFPAAALGPG